MMLFDTHFHLHPHDDIEEIIRRASLQKIRYFLLAGLPNDNPQQMLDRISLFPQVYAAIGIHPHDAEKIDHNILDEATYLELSKHPRVKAIGEIGLDYHYNYSPPEVQRKVFCFFLRLASAWKLPVVIHCRDAFADCYTLIKENLPEKVPFVIHCFTGSLEWAQRFLDLGAYLSYNGILTFKRSESIRDVMRHIPRDRLLFETDSPYLAPIPYRGKTNEPAYLPFIIKRAAEELGISFAELAILSTENGLHFFNISPQPTD